MEEITFSVHLNNREGSTLELFIREHWLAKKLLNDSALSLHLVMYIPILMKQQWWNAGNLFVVEKRL